MLEVEGFYKGPPIGNAGVPATAPVLFNPSQVATIRGWYDFSDGTTLYIDAGRTVIVSADGQTIRGISDKSGQANHATVPANGPTYRDNVQNGRSVGRFDGVNDVLVVPAGSTIAPGTGPLTLFLVVKLTGDSRLCSFDGGGAGWGLAGTAGGTTGRFTTLGILDYDAAAYWQLGSFVLATIVFDAGADVTFYRGGGAPFAGPVLGAAFANNPAALAFDIGARVSGGEWLNGDLAELLIYNSDLHTANLAGLNSIGAYLGNKWGLAWAAVP